MHAVRVGVKSSVACGRDFYLKTHLQQAQKNRLHLADAMVEKIVGPHIKSVSDPQAIDGRKNMTITTILSLGGTAFPKEAVIAPLVKKAGDSTDAKAIWSQTKLGLPEFYKQLKIEIDAGYLTMPAQADYTQ